MTTLSQLKQCDTVEKINSFINQLNVRIGCLGGRSFTLAIKDKKSVTLNDIVKQFEKTYNKNSVKDCNDAIECRHLIQQLELDSNKTIRSKSYIVRLLTSLRQSMGNHHFCRDNVLKDIQKDVKMALKTLKKEWKLDQNMHNQMKELLNGNLKKIDKNALMNFASSQDYLKNFKEAMELIPAKNSFKETKESENFCFLVLIFALKTHMSHGELKTYLKSLEWPRGMHDKQISKVIHNLINLKIKQDTLLEDDIEIEKEDEIVINEVKKNNLSEYLLSWTLPLVTSSEIKKLILGQDFSRDQEIFQKGYGFTSILKALEDEFKKDSLKDLVKAFNDLQKFPEKFCFLALHCVFEWDSSFIDLCSFLNNLTWPDELQEDRLIPSLLVLRLVATLGPEERIFDRLDETLLNDKSEPFKLKGIEIKTENLYGFNNFIDKKPFASEIINQVNEQITQVIKTIDMNERSDILIKDYNSDTSTCGLLLRIKATENCQFTTELLESLLEKMKELRVLVGLSIHAPFTKKALEQIENIITNNPYFMTLDVNKKLLDEESRASIDKLEEILAKRTTNPYQAIHDNPDEDEKF